ncbi:MAG: heavy-metal-associated domain-containing protein [Muribaculaceae bacterium]|nr:heavy-metal-associated domain-containing protein [Muribaculaceae bacterium]
MKKSFLLLAAASIAFIASAKTNNDTTVCFNVEPPMHCSNCENKIKKNLRFEKGVTKVETSVPNGTVTITYNKTKTDAEKVKAGFSKIGYKARPAKTK